MQLATCLKFTERNKMFSLIFIEIYLFYMTLFIGLFKIKIIFISSLYSSVNVFIVCLKFLLKYLNLMKIMLGSNTHNDNRK